MSMLTRVGGAVLLGLFGMACDHFGEHLIAIFVMCAAANCTWYDPPPRGPRE